MFLGTRVNLVMVCVAHYRDIVRTIQVINVDEGDNV